MDYTKFFITAIKKGDRIREAPPSTKKNVSVYCDYDSTVYWYFVPREIFNWDQFTDWCYQVFEPKTPIFYGQTIEYVETIEQEKEVL